MWSITKQTIEGAIMRKAIGRTDRGIIRESNQDQYAIIKEEDGIFAIVCDGIGGHAGGGKASNLVTKFIKSNFVNHPKFEDYETIQTYLLDLLQQANQKLIEQAILDPQYQGMGTTLVGVYISNNFRVLINIGDSRCYGIEDNRLVLLSDDHSYVNELVKLGKITKNQAKIHPYRNMLTNALGISDSLSVDISEIINDYDQYLLCSDGLHGYVKHHEISEVLLSPFSVTKKVKALIDKANDVGGFDNVTIVLIGSEVDKL